MKSFSAKLCALLRRGNNFYRNILKPLQLLFSSKKVFSSYQKRRVKNGKFKTSKQHFVQY